LARLGHSPDRQEVRGKGAAAAAAATAAVVEIPSHFG
jgi:hypothetical protein